jgi:outer membrane protein assembly factor BamD
MEDLTKQSAAAYSQIITRYPAMEREPDARKRLEALHQPIPRPTRAALAQNKAEEQSRHDANTLDRLAGVVKKGPDVSQAARVGDPTLTDPTPVAPSQLAQDAMRRVLGPPANEHGLSAEIVGKDAQPAPNEPAPRSDAPPANGQPFARVNTPADPNELKPAAPDPNELRPAGPADPNELKPTANSQNDAALPPPVQLNEIQQGPAAGDAAASSSSADLASDKDVSSSKKKKKKGLKKILAF